MEKIRKAIESDRQKLTDLACLSEAHWGFDQNYMRRFRVLYEMPSAYLNDHEVYLLESNGEPVAFYGLKREPYHHATLDYFYVQPERIGKHYGRRLWRHLVDFCEGHGLLNIDFVAGPEAEGFYTKMGAVKIGETYSHILKGRVISQIRYEIRTEIESKGHLIVPLRDH